MKIYTIQASKEGKDYRKNITFQVVASSVQEAIDKVKKEEPTAEIHSIQSIANLSYRDYKLIP